MVGLTSYKVYTKLPDKAVGSAKNTYKPAVMAPTISKI